MKPVSLVRNYFNRLIAVTQQVIRLFDTSVKKVRYCALCKMDCWRHLFGGVEAEIDDLSFFEHLHLKNILELFLILPSNIQGKHNN